MSRFFISVTIFVLICILNTKAVKGQSDSIRYQIGIGIGPHYIKEPFLNIEFKKYFRKRSFYGVSIEGIYTRSDNGGQLDDDYRFDIATSAAVGVYYNFFKICRFNMAAQLTGFFARQKSINELYSPPYVYGRSREGVFIGPEFSLEFRGLRFKSSEVIILSKIHSGFGLMHEKSYDNSPNYPIKVNDINNEWYGSITVGIGCRF